MKKLLLIVLTVSLTACGVENKGIVDDFKVTSISEDFCIEDKCVYTIKGNIDVMGLKFKADSSMIEYIEKGQILKFRRNENGFIEEILIN